MMPLAERLRARGRRVHLPDVLGSQPTPPPWSAWCTHLMARMSLDGRNPVVVGYSAALANSSGSIGGYGTEILSHENLTALGQHFAQMVENTIGGTATLGDLHLIATLEM